MAYEFDQLRCSLTSGKDWWTSLRKFPVKIMDQHFGSEIKEDDLVKEVLEADYPILERKKEVVDASGYSSITMADDCFEVEFSSNQFLTEEIKCKIEKGILVFSGKHEERAEGDGTITREFTRRYLLPHECDDLDPSKVILSPKSNGVVHVKILKFKKET